MLRGYQTAPEMVGQLEREYSSKQMLRSAHMDPVPAVDTALSANGRGRGQARPLRWCSALSLHPPAGCDFDISGNVLRRVSPKP